jgi:hypothetical protein
MATAPVYVDAPSIQPLSYTLLDTVPVLPPGDPHIGLGVQYEPEFCGPARTYPPACEQTEPATEKDADDGIGLVVGDPIPVYHLFQCRAPGAWSRAQERANRALDLGASRAVEEGLQAVFLADPALVDVTSGTAVSLVDALAELEQYAAENYGGTPVIHMSRDNALRLIALQAVYRVGNRLETGLGTPVVAGGGYDSQSGPIATPADSGWMFATGHVVIREGETSVSQPQLKVPEINEFVALSERTYTPTYECFVAAALATESV